MKLLIANATLLCSITGVLFLGGPLLAHLRVIPAIAGFGVFNLSVVFGILCLIAGIGAVKASQTQTGVLLFSVGALPVFLTGYTLATAGHHPLINDVSTDLSDPPALVDQSHPQTQVAFPEKNASIIKEFYGDLVPLRTTMDPDTVFIAAEDLVKSQPSWEIASSDKEAHTIQGFERFGLFQFTDDFTIRITPAPNGGSVVDMRSKSRNGKGDFGANAKRIRIFMEQLALKI